MHGGALLTIPMNGVCNQIKVKHECDHSSPFIIPENEIIIAAPRLFYGTGNLTDLLGLQFKTEMKHGHQKDFHQGLTVITQFIAYLPGRNFK